MFCKVFHRNPKNLRNYPLSNKPRCGNLIRLKTVLLHRNQFYCLRFCLVWSSLRDFFFHPKHLMYKCKTVVPIVFVFHDPGHTTSLTLFIRHKYPSGSISHCLMSHTHKQNIKKFIDEVKFHNGDKHI